MSERVNIRHEVNFLEYDGSSNVGGISIASPGLGGTDRCMAINISGTTPAYYSRSLSWSNYSPEILLRVHLDPNSLSMANGDAFTVIRVMEGANRFFSLAMSWNGTNYQVRASINNDAISDNTTSLYTINDADNVIEIYVLRASTASANNGQLILRTNDTNRQTISSLDIYSIFNGVDSLLVGAPFGIDAGTSGTFYLDEVSLRDDDYWPGSYAVAAAVTYYVSNAGSDGNAGTSTGSPWQTVGKVRTELLAGTIKGGDSVLFRAGDSFTLTNTTNLRIRSVLSTRIDKPVTFGRYGAGADPILDGTSVSGNANIYGLDRQDYVVIENLDIYNGPFGISIQDGARGWIVRDSLLRNARTSYLFQAYSGDWLQILNSEFDTAETECIYLGHSAVFSNDTQAIVYGNEIHDIQYDGVDLKSGALGCVVRGNTIYSCILTTGGTLGGCAINLRGSRHVIRENTIYDIGNTVNTVVGNIAGILMDTDGTGVRVEFNRINNLIAHASVPTWGIKLQHDGGDHNIMNNSLYAVDNNGLGTNDTSGPASTVKNNIVHTATDGIEITAGSVMPDSNYNIYYTTTNNTRVNGTAKSIATACTDHSIECNSTTGNPSFLDLVDLEIDSGSPAFETALASAANIQLFTNALSKGWHQPDEVLPYCVLKDGFELQNFSLWSSSTTDGGNLSVSTAAAIAAGNYGMQAAIGNTNVKYVERTSFGTPHNCHVRIYFDPNGITMASGDEIDIAQIRSSGVNLARLIFGYNGSSYYLRYTAAEDVSVVTHASSRYTITDAVHYAELSYHASSSSTYHRGYSILKIDGAYKEAFF